MPDIAVPCAAAAAPFIDGGQPRMIRRSRRWPPANAAVSRQNTRRRRPPAIAAVSRQNTRRRRPPAIAAGSRQNTRLRRLVERSRLGGLPREASEGKSAGTRPTHDTRELLSVRRPAPGIWRRRPTTTRPPPRQGGARGESGVVGRKTRTEKARSLTSRHERSLQDANSNTGEDCGKKSARAKSKLEKSARKGRGRAQSKLENLRRSGKGASVLDRSQMRVHGCAALMDGDWPALVGVPRVRLSPRGPERGCESVYGAARPPHHRLPNTGALPALTAQNRDGPPYLPRGTQAAYGPRQGPTHGRGTKGRRCGARLSRHTGSCRIVRLFGLT